MVAMMKEIDVKAEVTMKQRISKFIIFKLVISYDYDGPVSETLYLNLKRYYSMSDILKNVENEIIEVVSNLLMGSHTTMYCKKHGD